MLNRGLWILILRTAAAFSEKKGVVDRGRVIGWGAAPEILNGFEDLEAVAETQHQQR